MNPAVLALLALLVAIGVSMTSRVNVGVLSIGLAWVVGVYAAHLKPEAVIGGFPSSLFLTLAGATFLFAIAKSNGTLDLLAQRGAWLVRGNAGLLPILFFVLACLIATIGPGAIASVALVAPIAMATGARAGVPNFLSAVMVGTGANAGNLSPISAVGAMVDGLMIKIGLAGHEWKVWAANFLAHVFVALAAYVLFGGVQLLRRRKAVSVAEDESDTFEVVVDEPLPLESRHWLTVAVTVVWMVCAIVWRVNVGLSAFAAGTVLILMRVADEADVIKRIPLDVIFMVTGVTVLIAVLEATGGMELFTGMLAKVSSPGTLDAMIAFVTGAISTYSSTSGVVLPAFLPMVPGLVHKVGGEPLAVALSINVGSSLVDVSPLSTLGALCVAAVVDRTQARDLFRKLLAWGLSMTIVGALMCALLAPAFARA
ncbi:MAG TPA: SLC13 family permease [Gemmatimonadaceae bacterium]|jgi:di/tricarboxylate transporter